MAKSEFISFDHIMLAAMAQELQGELSKSRLRELWVPSVTTLVMRLQSPGRHRYLLVSIHPRYARIHLSTCRPSSSLQHPFVLLLKKRLEGAKLINVKAPVPLERILHLVFEGTQPTGEPERFILCAEIMGKHSNLILWEESSQKILGAFKTVGETQSVRPVYAGLIYQLPPQSHKQSPFLENVEFQRQLTWARLDQPHSPLDLWLQQTYQGVTPLISTYFTQQKHSVCLGSLQEAFCQELALRWQNFWDSYRQKEYRFLIQSLYPHWVAGPLSSWVESSFRILEEQEVQRQLRSRLQGAVDKAIAKVQRELEIFRSKIKEAEEAEQYKVYGELLKGGFHAIKKGDTVWTGPNYFLPGTPLVTIPLDPQKSPQENMKSYFKKYRKVSGSLSVSQKLLSSKEEEYTYLETVGFAVDEACSIQDLLEIEKELEASSYLKPTGPDLRRAVPKEIHLLKYISSDGYTILAGRNNSQNDYLTGKIAKDKDLWLHAHGIPGSHVIIQRKTGEEIPHSTLLEAAQIAAYHSKGRGSTKVPVLYTLVRYVTRIKGGKPGLVRYEREKSLMVEPRLPVPVKNE